jgi:hypothetical protein
VRGLSNIYSWQGSSCTISWAITRHAINRLCKPEAITVFIVFFEWVVALACFFLAKCCSCCCGHVWWCEICSPCCKRNCNLQLNK